MEKIHFEQSKVWLAAADYVTAIENTQKYAVAVSMLVHAIIKANDALIFKFTGTIPKRHDDARRLFEDLIKKNFIPSDYTKLKQTIQDAIDNKTKAEYRGGYFSKSDYDSLARKAKNFIDSAGKII